jgi:hypothetical protein
MMYALIKDGKVAAYPYGFNSLRQDNKNTSFPEQMTDDALAEWGVMPVNPVARPNVDHTKNITEGQPQFVNGKWWQSWSVSNASADEVKRRSDERAESVRSERNGLIAACDWTQLDDTPMTNTQKQAWAVYRQALRDVTLQPGFPWSVEWPGLPK